MGVRGKTLPHLKKATLFLTLTTLNKSLFKNYFNSNSLGNMKARMLAFLSLKLYGEENGGWSPPNKGDSSESLLSNFSIRDGGVAER